MTVIYVKVKCAGVYSREWIDKGATFEGMIKTDHRGIEYAEVWPKRHKSARLQAEDVVVLEGRALRTRPASKRKICLE